MKTLIIFLSFFFIFSCSSSEQMVDKDDQQKSNPYDESFDPNSLNDDDIVVHKFDAISVDNDNISGSASSQQEVVYKDVKGFRVQIIATKSIETATLSEQEAKDLFENMNHKIYLIFDAPLYKLRVGDVTRRDEAEEIRDVAKDYGYREAFIVPTKVNIVVDGPQ